MFFTYLLDILHMFFFPVHKLSHFIKKPLERTNRNKHANCFKDGRNIFEKYVKFMGEKN